MYTHHALRIDKFWWLVVTTEVVLTQDKVQAIGSLGMYTHHALRIDKFWWLVVTTEVVLTQDKVQAIGSLGMYTPPIVNR